MKRALFILIVLCLVVVARLVGAQEAQQSEREAMYRRYLEFPSYVKGGKVEPHWMADGNSFWYAEGAPDNTVIWKVDPTGDNWKTTFFESKRLRNELKTLGHELPGSGLPFDTFSFTDENETSVRFTVEQQDFILDPTSYELTKLPPETKQESRRRKARTLTDMHGRPAESEIPSPDGRWFLGREDFNIYVRSIQDGHRRQLTFDGTEDYGWDISQWSPDGSKIALTKTDQRNVPRLPTVDYLKPHDVVEWTFYPKANDSTFSSSIFVFDLASGSLVPIKSDKWLFVSVLGWRADSREILLARSDRYLRKVEVSVADTTTGETRVIHRETSKQINESWQRGGSFTLLKDGERFICESERDGRNQLYVHHIDDGRIRRLTDGAFGVQRVLAIDEGNGILYFIANLDRTWSFRERKRLYRVNLDGTEQTPLFEFAGEFSPITMSPSHEYFLHTHSTDELLPVVNLHAADGTFLQTVSVGKVDSPDLRWKPPEEFKFTAADGKTQLTGILYKPFDFDPGKKYPVIDDWFREKWVGDVCGGSQALAQLGFVTLVLTSAGNREDFRQLGRNEVADHVAALTKLAKDRSYIDLTRVGIIGSSYNGYHAVHAMLIRPDVFHVGVAVNPITDMSEHFGNDMVLGPPNENQEGYKYANNIRLAGNLEGKLLFITGTADKAVPFSHTMKMVDALIRAGKPYDLVVMPGQGHVFDSRSRDYARDVTRRYFQEHLRPYCVK